MKQMILPMPEELAAQIAAGEVVERPSSIVKELVENAIDAGASQIEIELEEGGIASIRVTDDGEGIEADQVPLVFERHATSKISAFDDLYRLQTLGFRGEAMYSIAAVSRVELLTRTAGSNVGTRCSLTGGRGMEIIDAGCPRGTTVRVRDLFFATPARKKFLKKPSTEQARCLDIAVKLALANPSISFQVKANKRLILNLRKEATMVDRLLFLRGDDFRNRSLVVNVEREELHLQGVISQPGLSRSNGKDIIWFINGRPLRDALLNQAVMAAYRSLIEPKRYPLAVLFLHMSGEDVDVNVHPAKLEVRFRQPADIFRIVSTILSDRLAGIERGNTHEMPGGSLLAREKTTVRQESVRETFPRYRVASTEKRVFLPSSHPPGQGILPVHHADECFPPETPNCVEGRYCFSDLEYRGTIAGTYIMLAARDSLVLVDQHAAHERILFEKLKMGGSGRSTISQRLLLPDIIDMTPGSFIILMDVLPAFREIGFDIEPYGDNTISVKAVPSLIAHVDRRSFIHDTIDEIEKTGCVDGTEEARGKLLAVMACHGAVRGVRTLQEEEVVALCKDLDSIPNAWTCPHGRPLFVIIDQKELEHLFKRR